MQLPPLPKEVAPELQPYAKRFMAVVSPYYDTDIIKNLKMGFADLEGMTVGECWTIEGGRYMRIDTKNWNSMDSKRKYALMLHELGHCVCGLRHGHFEGLYKDEEDQYGAGPGYMEDKCPVSVMHPKLVPTHCVVDHAEQYEYELRLRCMVQANRKAK